VAPPSEKIPEGTAEFPICRATFGMGALLHEHIFVRHVGGTFECDMRGAHFSACSTLRKHYLSSHMCTVTDADVKIKAVRRDLQAPVAQVLNRATASQ